MCSNPHVLGLRRNCCQKTNEILTNLGRGAESLTQKNVMNQKVLELYYGRSRGASVLGVFYDRRAL